MPGPHEFLIYRRRLRTNAGALAYLRDRGLTDDTWRKWRWGYGAPDSAKPSGFVIPVPWDRPATYRTRFWPEPWLPPGTDKPVKIASPRGHPVRLWPTGIPRGSSIVLTEGEFDAAIGWQHGIRAIATPGCQIKASLAEVLGRSMRQVPVIFDVGAEEAAARAVRLLRLAGAQSWHVPLPLSEHGADLTDYFLAGGTESELRELIREAKR